MIARFRETIPTVKPVSSSEIKKFISDFDRNYHFTLLSKIRIFRGFTLTTVDDVGGLMDGPCDVDASSSCAAMRWSSPIRCKTDLAI